MKIYLVGGAVRDQLMGLEPKDLDYVVVGSTPEAMINYGYKQVGADFPVFLHPETGDEYALARTEVKDGNGYQGFNCAFGPEVTLEEDLARRDLTINAIARDVITGEIFDPFNGQRDLADKLLRPTTEAFSEDPVRVLRAARFLARYPDFGCTAELLNATREMKFNGDLDHLVPERVWLEMQKALTEIKPSRFFEFICRHTDLLPEISAFMDVQEDDKWHPEYDVFEHIMLSLDYAVKYQDPITSFGVLCHDMGKPAAYAASGGEKSTRHESLGLPIVENFCNRLKVPSDYKYSAMKACEFHTHVHMAYEMKPKTIHKLMKNFKDQSWFCRLLDVAVADKRGRGEPKGSERYTQPNYLYHCWTKAFILTDTKAITSTMEPGPKVGEAIRTAQIKAISELKKENYV